MGLLNWLLGKKEPAVAVSAAAERGPLAVVPSRPAPPPEPERSRRPSEADNLRRWRESGQARAWVEARRGQWGHAEWLALLDELKRSSFWPMEPDAVGQVLEAAKHEWLHRN